MVAESLPSFDDDYLKNFKKRNEGKKNKIKEKCSKEDINVASKYNSDDVRDRRYVTKWNRFGVYNADADNKDLEEYRHEDVISEDNDNCCKKNKEGIIRILKNPQFERRSKKLDVAKKADDEDVTKMTDSSRVNTEATKLSKVITKTDTMCLKNTKAENDRQNTLKKSLSETSVKQYLRVAIEHEDTEEKKDHMKDDNLCSEEKYESLITCKSPDSTESLKDSETFTTEDNRSVGCQTFDKYIKDKDLINIYKQLESRGIFDRCPDELTSLMETTIENVNRGLMKLIHLSFNQMLTSQGREVKEKSSTDKAEKMDESIEKETDYDEKELKIQIDVLPQNKDKVLIYVEEDEKDPDTTEDTESDKMTTVSEFKTLPNFNFENVLQKVETLTQELEIQMRAQITDFHRFKKKLITLQKKFTSLTADKSFHMTPDVKCAMSVIDHVVPSSKNVFIPETSKKRRVSPLEHFKFNTRCHSSKGDNQQGNQQNGHRGNSKKDDSGGSDKEFSRKHEEEKDRDEQEEPFDPPDNDKVDGIAGNDPENSNPTVLPNYKFRRKHGQLKDGNTQLAEIIGKLKDINENIPPDILEQLNHCLVNCLSNTRREDTQECSICIWLSSLISHFGGCLSDYLQCSECIPIFSLIIQHVSICLHSSQTKEESCTILCRKIAIVASYDVRILKKRSNQLWIKLKKYMARYQVSISSIGGPVDMDSDDLFSMSSLGSLSSIRSVTGDGIVTKPPRVQRPSTSYLPSLGIIPEKGGNFSVEPKPKPVGRGRNYPKSISEPLYRKHKDGTVQCLKKEPSPLVNGQQSASVSENPLRSVGALGGQGRKSHSEILYRRRDDLSLFGNAVKTGETVGEARKTSRVRKISFEQVDKKIPEDEVDQKPLDSFDDEEEYDDQSWNEGIYGGHIVSLPVGFQVPNRQGSSDQLLSLVETPTGVPGIGEVVYGTRQHFLKVIRHWTELKEEYERRGVLPQHLREEGVVLEEAKNAKLLRIFGTRYQKNFQWIRMTHLGSGMSGKCHLCMDYNTEFKFCIKKLHISKYEEKELDIWSELKHKHIVRLLGAMRYGEKIYIMQDFVDGGCLTETINSQKQTRRRLSHWTALCYFKQILEVLKYFQSKRIIHEDLKADNILLIQNTKRIAITDFGVAQRINKESNFRGGNPLGTPTQLSPEKAQSQGHGFKSDVWSAVCVLVHMLSGSPPWMKRFPNVNVLNYIIVQHSPPLQDVPSNVSLDVQDLIRQGFTVSPTERPSAEQLLQHRAFKLLDEYDPETFSSMLLTSTRELPGTILPEESESSNDDDYKVLEQLQQDLKNDPAKDSIASLYPLAKPEVGDAFQRSITVCVVTSTPTCISSKKNVNSPPLSNVDGPNSSQLQNSSGSDVSELKNSERTDDPQLQNPNSINGQKLQPSSGGNGSKLQNSSKRLSEVLPGINRESLPDVSEGAVYISKEDLEKLGVCMPPDYETLIQRDPINYHREHMTDDMVNHSERNLRYKNFLTPYKPEPIPKSRSFSQDLDIEKIFEKQSDIPNFEMLLSNEDSVKEERSSSQMPDIHTQLNTLAIESMLNQSASSANVADEFKRSSSHKEENEKIDEELSALRQQLEHEALDLQDHQSLIKILNQPVTETGGNTSVTPSLKSDPERTPSDLTPVPTMSELPDNCKPEKKLTCDIHFLNEINSGPATLPDLGNGLAERSTLDHGPATLPNFIENLNHDVLLDQLTQFHMPVDLNESFKSDELFAAGPDIASPSIVLNGNNDAMAGNEDADETYPLSTIYPVRSNNLPWNAEPIEVEVEEIARTHVFDHDHFAVGAISDFSSNQNRELLAVDHRQAMSLQYRETNSKNDTNERKANQKLRLDLSPNTKRKQFSKRPNLSNPEINSQSSSPTTVPPFYTPQDQGPNIEFSTTKKDTGLGSSLPYMNPQGGRFNKRQDSDSSGVITSPRLKYDPDQEIEEHFLDLKENLSQSSHDTSHNYFGLFDEDEVNLDKSPSSWMLASTEEDESIYVQQTYLDNTSTGGTRITVQQPDGERCVSLSLTNEHRNRTWKDIIEADLSQQIHMKGFRKFSLNDTSGEPINLNTVPVGEKITVQIVEPTEQHWYSENNVMFEFHF